jgi:hypothetical protein
MPSLTRKFIKGRPYYYLRHCQRIDGKPKIVKTLYLGSADQLVARLAAPPTLPEPLSVEVAAFADMAALFDLAEQIGLVPLIDARVPKRDQGLSIGQYLLLAAINRATHPTSKTRLADWYQRTVLTRLLPAAASQLSSQAFWNHLPQSRRSGHPSRRRPTLPAPDPTLCAVLTHARLRWHQLLHLYQHHQSRHLAGPRPQ